MSRDDMHETQLHDAIENMLSSEEALADAANSQDRLHRSVALLINSQAESPSLQREDVIWEKVRVMWAAMWLNNLPTPQASDERKAAIWDKIQEIETRSLFDSLPNVSPTPQRSDAIWQLVLAKMDNEQGETDELFDTTPFAPVSVDFDAEVAFDDTVERKVVRIDFLTTVASFAAAIMIFFAGGILLMQSARASVPGDILYPIRQQFDLAASSSRIAAESMNDPSGIVLLDTSGNHDVLRLYQSTSYYISTTASPAAVRSGPGSAYSLLTQLEYGEAITVVGFSVDHSWVMLDLGFGQKGWIYQSLVTDALPAQSNNGNTGFSESKTQEVADDSRRELELSL